MYGRAGRIRPGRLLRLGCLCGRSLLLVALPEAVHPASGIDELLRPRVERVAGRAHVDREVSPGGARDERVAARAVDAGRGVVRVNAVLHSEGKNIVSDAVVCKDGTSPALAGA